MQIHILKFELYVEPNTKEPLMCDADNLLYIIIGYKTSGNCI